MHGGSGRPGVGWWVRLIPSGFNGNKNIINTKEEKKEEIKKEERRK